MTTTSTTNLLRTLFVIFAGSVGAMVGDQILGTPWLGTSIGLVFGLLLVLMDRLLKGVSLRAFSSATFGLLLGLVAAWLLKASEVLKYLPEEAAWAISLLVYVAFGYLGMMLAMRSNRDEFSLVIPYVRFSRSSVHDSPVIVDSNILIDGRLSEVAKTGFLSASLVVPSFIIEELQKLADSSDPLKRESGRRGLDNLSAMQHSELFNVTIHEGGSDDALPTDHRLVRLAQTLGARLLTNDAPLVKVGRLQGVQVLSFNELLHALGPPLTAGQHVQIELVKPGRDAHQAVGFLEDGTMVVVNHAAHWIGRSAEVVIAGNLKTASGRLFFGHLADEQHKK